MIFTVDIDGVPTVSFAASSKDSASGFVGLDEFRHDLSLMSSSGRPICSSLSHMRLRLATDNEAMRYRTASGTPAAYQEAPAFVFLVQVDGVIVHSIQRD
jgi:hypothetical protein